MDIISKSFRDDLHYWEPTVVDSTGTQQYAAPIPIKGRWDVSVNKEIRDYLVDKTIRGVFVTDYPVVIGGWICRVSDVDDDLTVQDIPTMQSGAMQILHVRPVTSYDLRRTYWEAPV